MIVRKNMVVYFRYIMKNSKGFVIENTMADSPKCYLHGSCGIQSSLQLQFEDLKVGDTKVIYLKKKSTEINEDFTFDVIIDKLRPALQEEQILGYPFLIDNSVCESDCICHR